MNKVLELLKKFFKKYWLAFVIATSCIVIDLITKKIATAKIPFIINSNGRVISDSLTVVDGLWYWTYARNTGAGWSIASDKTWLLIIITFIALGVMIYCIKDFNMKKLPFYSLGLALMIGGCIGNLWERVLQGYVTDFIDFIIFTYDYPIFNVADMCLVVGGISLIVQILFFSKAFNEIEKENKKADSIESKEL